MNYSLTKDRLDKLKSLLACDAIRILDTKQGGNSVVFCVEADNQQWAVKCYPPFAPEQRDRLDAELKAYRFFNRHSILRIAEFKTVHEPERWLVTRWIKGAIPEQYSDYDVRQALLFIHSIHQSRYLPGAMQLPEAAEACLSLRILLEQIERRFQVLQLLSKEEQDLNDFLVSRFQPIFKYYKDEALNGFHKNKINPDTVLAREDYSLIPADFGFHNAIRDPEKRLHFFDFDYFGWDDPVKLLADILWHPKMRLSDIHKQQFIKEFSSDIYKNDSLFLTRFNYTYPLFGLRWILILLNDFVPAVWQNRKHTHAYQNHEEVKKIQLQRAKEYLTLCEIKSVST